MGEVGLKLERQENETWREAAIRVARTHGLEEEVGNTFDSYIAQGDTEAQAAWAACYDWDLCELAFVGGSDRPPPEGGAGAAGSG